MGLYINPKEGTKEQWLTTYGKSHPDRIPTQCKVGDEYVVCLVDNGLFTAAAVCYSQGELEEFTNIAERPCTFFLVKEEHLQSVCGSSYNLYIK